VGISAACVVLSLFAVFVLIPALDINPLEEEASSAAAVAAVAAGAAGGAESNAAAPAPKAIELKKKD